MQKIKFVADTASDIPDQDLREFGIDMPSVPVAVDGREYWERRSFSILEFYDVLKNAGEIPSTSRVPVEDYLTCYRRAWEQGYTHIISVTINAGGSGTHTSAQMAKVQLFQDHPEAREQIEIHVVDSRTYSVAYGYFVVEAARMARRGKTAAEILDYLQDTFDHLEIYLACYSLEYARKSGRIGAAAAFVGDVLGLRPIILMANGKTKTVEKVRGNKTLPAKLYEAYEHSCTDKDAPVVLVRGCLDEPVDELKRIFRQRTGKEPPDYYAGASIVINSGPELLAIVCRGKKRVKDPAGDAV